MLTDLSLDSFPITCTRLPQALTSDPNFLRISMGAYSLHCFHPDKEQVRRAPLQRPEPADSCVDALQLCQQH